MNLRRIILVLDGTWNSDPPLPGVEPTNGLQIARRISQQTAGTEQSLIYLPGVGVGWSHLAGYTGHGIGRIIRAAYRRLAELWRPGDEIFLFGVSRGAYAAVSLARWMDGAGLPESPLSDEALTRSFAAYRDADVEVQRALPGRRPAPIRFLGAFDAVDALGLPLPCLRGATRPRVGFHSARLPGNIKIARHALALDEIRGAFEPTLWIPPAHPGQSIEQVWFPGSHPDVCGGFGKRAISDYTLLWMMAEAEKAGLVFDPVRRDKGLRPQPDAEPSRQFGGLHRLVPQRPRRPGRVWPETERLDESAAIERPNLAQ